LDARNERTPDRAAVKGEGDPRPADPAPRPDPNATKAPWSGPLRTPASPAGRPQRHWGA